MPSSKDLDLFADSNFILFKGDPVTRKTANAGGWRPGERLLVQDIDGKCGSIKIAHPNREFDYFRPKDHSEFSKHIDELDKNCPYGTVVLDSLTSLVKMELDYSLSFRVMPKKADDDMNRWLGNVPLANWDDYKYETQIVDKLLQFYKKLANKGVTIIFIAHVVGTGKEEVDGRKVEFRTLFTAAKNTRHYIPSQFKEIYHFYPKKSMDPTAPPNYVISTQSTTLDFASSMLGLPNEIDVTDGKLYEKIQEYLKNKK